MRLPRLPDILTTANLSCGVGSILLASQGQLTLACWLVFAGAAFDVLDGLAARALGGGSELGKQLDSLADMVTFGVAPGAIIFCLPLLGSSFYLSDLHILGEQLENGGLPSGTPFRTSHAWTQWLAAIVIPVASAWRLAKFNIDTRQSTGFLGLPTPANALFWASTVLALNRMDHYVGMDWPMNIGAAGATQPMFRIDPSSFSSFISYLPHILLGMSLVLGILMLSELPLPSLKFKHMKWKGNEVIYILLGIGLVLVLLCGILAVPLILLLYLLSPLWGRLFPKTA